MIKTRDIENLTVRDALKKLNTDNLNESLNNISDPILLIQELLKKKFGGITGSTRCYISPDGSFINAPGREQHMHIIMWLNYALYESDYSKIEHDEVISYGATEPQLDNLKKYFYFWQEADVFGGLEKLHFIRCSGGREHYVIFNSEISPTLAQYDSLLSWLDEYYSATGYDSMKFIFFTPGKAKKDNGKFFKTVDYCVKEKTPDDVIKNIKRYYATGNLVEDKKNK